MAMHPGAVAAGAESRAGACTGRLEPDGGRREAAWLSRVTRNSPVVITCRSGARPSARRRAKRGGHAPPNWNQFEAGSEN